MARVGVEKLLERLLGVKGLRVTAFKVLEGAPLEWPAQQASGGRTASFQSRQRRSRASGPLILVAVIDSWQLSDWQGHLYSP